MEVITENLPKDNVLQDLNICALPYGSQDCCSKGIKYELLKRSTQEVNDGYKSYISFCVKEMRNLLRNLKYFIELKFVEIGGSLLELKCRSQLSVMIHSRYLECLRIYRDGITEAAESFSRSRSANNDSFDNAAEFLFNLVISLQNPNHQKNSSCFWLLERAISSQISQVLSIFRSLSDTHYCGQTSRHSRYGGGRGTSAVWEFMRRTKMSGRVFYLLRSIVHLMETTKTLEYLQWLLQELSSFDLGSHGCDRMLMQMRHCSLCAGYPLVHPCPSFCEVTLTHCLRPINKIQPPWNNIINTLYEQLQAWSNLPNPILKNIIIYSPRAILEFQKTIVKSVQDVAPLDCRFTYNLIESGTDRLPEMIPHLGRVQSSAPLPIQTQFMRISHKMQSLKGLWINAPSKICRESPRLSLSTTASSQNCWNGSAVGAYITSDLRDKNGVFASQWNFYSSPDRSALNSAASDSSDNYKFEIGLLFIQTLTLRREQNLTALVAIIKS
nr:glypican 1 [Hymenolepis microstoma]